MLIDRETKNLLERIAVALEKSVDIQYPKGEAKDFIVEILDPLNLHPEKEIPAFQTQDQDRVELFKDDKYNYPDEDPRNLDGTDI